MGKPDSSHNAFLWQSSIVDRIEPLAVKRRLGRLSDFPKPDFFTQLRYFVLAD
ncbi:hypothetical protein JZU56_02370 [bacterium]|nr:hypothetical protein [bacterium]